MRYFLGFTLIELMVVLAISAVLLRMAYPAYTHYVIRAERSRAMMALLQLSGLLEAYFGDNATYQHATIHSLHANTLTKDIHYQLKIMRATDTHYAIEAIPTGSQAIYDAHCGALILNDLNQRSISGDGNAESCWG